MTINIANSLKFNNDDVSSAINDVVANLNQGDTAFLPYGNYKIANTIHIQNKKNNLKNCTITLDGVYEVTNHNLPVSIKVQGDYFNFNLGYLTSNDKSDYYNQDENDILPGGISFAETTSSRFHFSQIEGFEFGIRLYPDVNYSGVCFNKFHFDYISYCYTPILFSMPDDVTCWVNENQFYGGVVKGYFGVRYIKGAQQIDEYNNNTFYNISFGAIETDAIVSDFCAFNTYLCSRFEFVNMLTIKESETCKNNKYITSVDIPLCSIKLKSKNTIINGPIYNNNWEDILKGMHTDKYCRPHYDFFYRTTMEVDNENKELRANIGYVNVDTNNASVELMLNEVSEFTDNKIEITVNNYVHPISIVNAKGNVIIPKGIITAGIYSMTFNKSWKVFKLCDKPLFTSDSN